MYMPVLYTVPRASCNGFAIHNDRSVMYYVNSYGEDQCILLLSNSRATHVCVVLILGIQEGYMTSYRVMCDVWRRNTTQENKDLPAAFPNPSIYHYGYLCSVCCILKLNIYGFVTSRPQRQVG